ncbi:MAG: DUF1376 domain-containing protein, partial [Duodenibacillus sp.]
MNYYDHNIGDFASMTQGLDFESVGICIRLLDRLMLTEKPIKTQWVFLAFHGETQAKAMSVLEAFFEKTDDDGWIFEPYMRMIERYQANSLKNKENGKKGGRPKKTNENPSGSGGFSTETQNNPMGFSGFSTETQTEPKQKATNNQEPITKIDSSARAEEPKATRKAEAKTLFLSCSLSDSLCDDWREQLCQRRPDLTPHAEAVFFDFKDYWTKGDGRLVYRTPSGWRRTWINYLAKARAPVIPQAEKPSGGWLPIPPEQKAKIDAERAAGKVYVPKPVVEPKPKTDKLWGVNDDLPDDPP